MIVVVRTLPCPGTAPLRSHQSQSGAKPHNRRVIHVARNMCEQLDPSDRVSCNTNDELQISSLVHSFCDISIVRRFLLIHVVPRPSCFHPYVYTSRNAISCVHVWTRLLLYMRDAICTVPVISHQPCVLRTTNYHLSLLLFMYVVSRRRAFIRLHIPIER